MPSGENQVAAAGGESTRDSESDAAARARDEGDVSAEACGGLSLRQSMGVVGRIILREALDD